MADGKDILSMRAKIYIHHALLSITSPIIKKVNSVMTWWNPSTWGPVIPQIKDYVEKKADRDSHYAWNSTRDHLDSFSTNAKHYFESADHSIGRTLKWLGDGTADNLGNSLKKARLLGENFTDHPVKSLSDGLHGVQNFFSGTPQFLDDRVNDLANTSSATKYYWQAANKAIQTPAAHPGSNVLADAGSQVAEQATKSAVDNVSNAAKVVDAHTIQDAAANAVKHAEGFWSGLGHNLANLGTDIGHTLAHIPHPTSPAAWAASVGAAGLAAAGGYVGASWLSRHPQSAEVIEKTVLTTAKNNISKVA